MITGMNTRTFRRATGDDMLHQQSIGGLLEFNAKSNKVALNLRIEVVELSASEERGILIEASDGRRSHFHQRHAWRNSKRRIGTPRDPRSSRLRLRKSCNRASGSNLFKLFCEKIIA